MKLKTLLLIPILAAPLGAQDYQIHLASLTGSLLTFHGDSDSFTFMPESGLDHRDFVITASDDSLLTGLTGNITGLFTIGPITTEILGGGVVYEYAPVSSTGATFSITDDDGYTLTATLVWNLISTTDRRASTGGLNGDAIVNLTDFSAYAGSNSRLHWLASTEGILTIDFGFSPDGKSLSELVADGVYPHPVTAYSGDATFYVLAAIPEPAAATALAGLLVLGFAVVMQSTRPRPDHALDV